jgi:hypothetical protein
LLSFLPRKWGTNHKRFTVGFEANGGRKREDETKLNPSGLLPPFPPVIQSGPL